MEHEPHADPIRRGALLYNIFNTRRGHATAWEELMMQAGMFEAKPRSRELIYILVAERAARALGDLRMSGYYNESAEPIQIHCRKPRGRVRLEIVTFAVRLDYVSGIKHRVGDSDVNGFVCNVSCMRVRVVAAIRVDVVRLL